jgi:putative restriction endonuclease
MLNSLEIESQLKTLGFTQRIDNKRINGFVHDDIKYPLYVKTPSGNSKSESVVKNPLVIHSQYEGQKQSLSEIKGIYPDWENYYRNSNMKSFDKPNNSKSKSYYGIALNIENEKALKNFVTWLSGSLLFAKPSASEYEDIENAKEELSKTPETTREMLIQARKGQGSYRDELMAYWRECSVSDVNLPSFLRASHIKPWRDSDNVERLDRYNGLLLNPILDVAFDQGYISFSDEGKILISDALSGKEKALSISSEMSLKKIDLEHHKYLEWHRRNIFKDNDAKSKTIY